MWRLRAPAECCTDPLMFSISFSVAISSIFSCVSACNVCPWPPHLSRSIKHQATIATHALTWARKRIDQSISPATSRRFALNATTSQPPQKPWSSYRFETFLSFHPYPFLPRRSLLLLPPLRTNITHTLSLSLHLLSAIRYSFMLYSKTCHTCRCPKHFVALLLELFCLSLFSITACFHSPRCSGSKARHAPTIWRHESHTARFLVLEMS